MTRRSFFGRLLGAMVMMLGVKSGVTQDTKDGRGVVDTTRGPDEASPLHQQIFS